MGDKATIGNYFEDLTAGLEIEHAVPRTLTEGDAAMYIALTADRYPLHCDAEFARSLGFQRETINDLLVFHTVFGKSVPDISLNAVANLGYADVRFGVPVYPGDTLRAHTTVLGRRESASGGTGVVWVHTVGRNQHGDEVLSFIRWVLVNRRQPEVSSGVDDAPRTPASVANDDLTVPPALDLSRFDPIVTGGRAWWGDYEPGERIHHVEGVAIEEAEHQMAARLYQNTARAHFNAHALKDTRFGKRVIYGGHIISMARALSFNGLANAQVVAAINAGAHTAPAFAGDTVYAWSEVLDKADTPAPGVGALRLRLVATKGRDESMTLRGEDGKYASGVLLDLDIWALCPR